jgi:amino acid adenylation domain-containing protein/thioester reductase-like protein
LTEYSINLSQAGIWQNEIVSRHSAINVISVKMKIDGFQTDAVRQAADKVLLSADIFRASLKTDGSRASFNLNDAPVSLTNILGEMTADDISVYTGRMDKTPFAEGELYRIEAIPVSGGGVMLYARFHHLIIDGYGMSLFCQRIIDALEGKELPESSFFTDEKNSVPENDKDFWLEYFENADFRPALFSGESSAEKTEYAYTPDQDLNSAVEKFSAENGLNPAYVFLGALALYMAKAAGKNDAVILMPRLNRTISQRQTLGCYTLLIPVRVHVSGCRDFTGLCLSAQSSARSAALHKQYGFDEILNLCREEDLTEDSFSEYVLNYYSCRLEGNVRAAVDVSVAGEMRNHLTWNIFNFDGTARFSFDLNNGFYDQERIRFFIDSILGIIKDGLSGKPLPEIPIVGAKEKERLYSVKGKTVPFSQKDTIVSIFRKAVRENADRPAVYAGNETLTFSNLDELSDRIAGGLESHGVRCGDVVAFILHRNLYMIPTIFGILKTGAAFVPIDSQYPTERIENILSDSGAKFLISSDDVENAPAGFLEIKELAGSEPQAAQPDIDPRSPAYMIYTSGSTGKPKGVILPHTGIVSIVLPDSNPFNRAITGLDGSAPCHGITAVGSIGFDISLYEIFVPLMNGMFVELTPENALTDPAALAKIISAHHADILHCTPSRLASYLKLPAFTEVFGGIRAVLSAGEVLLGSFVNELKKNYGTRIFNGYGPTETTIGATITEDGDNRSIGRPIANTGLLILNRNSELIPYGASGEICIYGAGVGLGYKNLPEITEKKFCILNGLSIYHTGDLGYLDKDGCLIYQGRNDRLIKLRGLRIELPEIENAVGQYPGVLSDACIVRKSGKSEYLVCFYTSEESAEIKEDDLKKHLRGQLPPYMVPNALVRLEEMPHTISGKTDLRALADYPVEFSQNYTPPSNDSEKFICEKMQAVLKCDRIGAADNFFEMGGTSLDTVMLMMELETRFGEGSLNVRMIYEAPTPAALAAKLADKAPENDEAGLGNLDYEGIPSVLNYHPEILPEKEFLGTVLLSGATGYLGVHILLELMKHPDRFNKVFCLARSDGKRAPETRVRTALFYYGENDFDDLYGTKWEVIEGDLSNPGIFAAPFTEKIDTVINSAAIVAHFSHDSTLSETNTEGARRLIDFCMEKNARLCQVSTISVGGSFPADGKKHILTEQDLYIGQDIRNQYILSKYMAEYSILKAAAGRGLKASIMRVGNLQGRIRDGEFQMNMKTNAFTRQMSSYVRMGAAPESVCRSAANFSPVDDVARMIVELCGIRCGLTAFHVYPPEEIPYAEMFRTLNDLGIPVRTVDDAAFEEMLRDYRKTEEGKKIIEGLLMERPDIHWKMTDTDNSLTLEVLHQCHQEWTPASEAYLKQYFSILRDMEMF